MAKYALDRLLGIGIACPNHLWMWFLREDQLEDCSDRNGELSDKSWPDDDTERFDERCRQSFYFSGIRVLENRNSVIRNPWTIANMAKISVVGENGDTRTEYTTMNTVQNQSFHDLVGRPMLLSQTDRDIATVKTDSRIIPELIKTPPIE